MFSTDDSIVAIATPAGRGGIGVVRISGPSAQGIAARLLDRSQPLGPRHATLTRIAAALSQQGGATGGSERGRAPGTEVVDEVVATYFPAPHSYTGEHVVEISAHGNPVVLEAIVARAIAAGARLADPGEFTLRAFLNGKRDLVQAEAVADLIAAATPLQARIAFDQLDGTLTGRIAAIDAPLFDLIARLEASLDFPDEGYHFIEPAVAVRTIGCLLTQLDDLLAGARAGRLIRDGATVVVAGRPNVGKSSLFNLLAGADRAIVTPIAGTTRDLVSERVDIEGLAVTLVDTAGWHETHDLIEREGVARSEQARGVADLVVLVLDRSEPLRREDEELLGRTASAPRIIVANKSDLPARLEISRLASIDVSATIGDGVGDLRRAIVRELTGRESLRDTAAISNTRHIALLDQARSSLAAAAAAAPGTPEEFILADLQAARARLDEVVGARTSDDVLRHIFERFCIGK
jgi:tRNA modification GTPase